MFERLRNFILLKENESDKDLFTRESFSELIEVLDGLCGVLILHSEQEDGYIEFASSGYDESGFFYDFMIRGNGYFEELEGSEDPLLFSSEEFQLYHRDSTKAIVVRIFDEKVLGFLILECTEKTESAQAAFLMELYSKAIIERNSKKQNKYFESYIVSELIQSSEILLSQVKDWKFKVDRGLNLGSFSIRSKSGSGEKSVVKYIFHKLGLKGDLVFLNEIPEQLVKLERYIGEWIEIAREGFLVFEKIEKFTPGQQKLFFDILAQNPESKFVFLTRVNEFPTQEYPSFWKKVRENEIYLPELPSLDTVVRKKLVEALAMESMSIHNRNGLHFTDQAMSLLLTKSDTFMFDDIKSILELAIIQSRKEFVELEDIQKLYVDKSPGNYEEDELDLRKSVENLEKQKILKAMKIFSGNQIRMSKALGISRGSLQYKMKQFGLN